MYTSTVGVFLLTIGWTSAVLSSSLHVGIGYCSSSWQLSSFQNSICLRNEELPDVGTLSFVNASNVFSSDDQTSIENESSQASDRREQWFSSQECIKSNDSGNEYCAYTSSAFAAGRGLALWTTPDAASRFVDLPAFTDPNALSGVNFEPRPPYIVTPVPGKGLGLIANKTLRRGDRIFSTTPLYIADSGIYDELELADRSPIQHRAIHRLPTLSIALYNNLLGHFSQDDHVEDVINTNCFSLDLFDNTPDAREFYVVLPEISRLNHDCRPNTHFYFDPQTLTQHVHAIRTIHLGEELTISYMDAAQPRRERLDHLHSTWGFSCSCSACTAPDAIANESDSRLRELISVQEKLADRSASSTANPAMAELLVSLYEQEGMWAPIADAYNLAAFEYSGVGELQLARKYARLATEAQLLYSGPHSEEFENVKSLLRNPRQHWSWEFRLPGKGTA